MADPTPPPPAPPRDARNDRLKQALIAVALMVLVGAAFYFIGRMQGREPVPALEAEVASAEAEMAAVQDRARLHEALALTYRTTVDLDARNFGTANERLHAAARALDGLSGIDGAEVDALRRTMAETDLTVGADLQQQRGQVLRFAEEIEALLDGGAPTAGGAAPAAP